MISLYSKFQVNLMNVVNLISIGNKDTTICPGKVGTSEVQLIRDVNIQKKNLSHISEYSRCT